MRKQQSGFTLIELVMVIVILGILAATALPRFIDLTADAEAAAAAGAEGALSSAASINYAAGLAGNASARVTTGMTCTQMAATDGTGILTNDNADSWAGSAPTGVRGATRVCTATVGGTAGAGVNVIDW